MDCPHQTEQHSCKFVDAAVGELVVLQQNVCAFCITNYPDPDTRASSYAVESSIFAQRTKRGLPAPVPRPFRNPPKLVEVRKTVLKDHSKAEARMQRVEAAPVVADPSVRLEICEDCDQWSATNERCTALCNCKTRPRPLAETGKDCPIGKWRR